MKQYEEYLSQFITTLQWQERELIAADRKDDANLTRIKSNVYGICQTVWGVFAKNPDLAAACEKYRAKLDDLDRTWSAALSQAKEHDDTTQAVIEELKLQALRDARNHFIIYSEEALTGEVRS